MSRNYLQVTSSISIVSVLMLGLASCSNLKEKAGLTKKAPDEFTVITKAPLIMPPEFSLRPPRPGAKQLKVIQPGERARKAVFDKRTTEGQAKISGRDTITSASSIKKPVRPKGSELKLLQKARAETADPSIRKIVNKETSILSEKNSSLADRLIFWQEKQADGSAVDAGKESKRLREAAAAGDPPNKTKTVIIKRRKKALFEGLIPEWN